MIFLLILAGHGLIDTFFPAPRPRLLGAEARRDRVMQATATWRDGSLARLVEHDLRLTSRVRRTVGPWYSLVLFRFFSQTTERGIAGNGGWVYIRGRVVPPGDPGAGQAARTAAQFAALERRLALRGTRLVVIPVPRKAALYPEHLPRGSNPRPELDELLIRSLKRRGIVTADLLAAWERRLEPDELVYFQTDSHWTDTAQLWAAEETARAAGALVPVGERRSRIASLGTIAQERDTLDFVGLQLPERAFDFLALPKVPTFGLIRDGEAAKAPQTEHRNPSRRPRQALFGTSFSASRRFPLFLEHFIQVPLWNAAEAGSYPLEVMTEILERYSEITLEVLFLELPQHQILGERSPAGLEQFFARLSPPADPPPFVLFGLLGRQRWSENVDGRLEMARLSMGRLAHSGDGIAELVLSGRIEGEDIAVVVAQDDGEMRFEWPAGRSSVVLPLVTGRPTAGALTVAFEGQGRIYLERLEAISHLDRDAAVRGRCGRPRVVEDGWWQSLSFVSTAREAPPIVNQSGLVLILENDVALAECSITVHAGNKRRRFAVSTATKMVFNLDPLAGKNLERVEIECAGPVPAHGVVRALLLPPI